MNPSRRYTYRFCWYLLVFPLLLLICDPRGTRTPDPPLKRRLLYTFDNQLSYEAKYHFIKDVRCHLPLVAPLGLEPRLSWTKTRRVTNYTKGQFSIRESRIFVGTEGFEPPNSNEDRFTVCQL